jgi:hypothetical protein
MRIMTKQQRSAVLTIPLVLVQALTWFCIADCCRAGEGSGVEAHSLVERCLKTQAVMDHVSMRITTEREIPNPSKGWPSRQRAEAQLRRDGQRLDVSLRYLVPGNTEEFKERSQRSRAVFSKDGGIFYWTLASRSQPPRHGLMDNDWAKWFTEHAMNEVTGGPLDGYFQPSGTGRIAELVADAPALHLRGVEVIAGTPCKVIEAATQHGTYTMWLAESFGCLPLKVTCELGPNDVYDYMDGRVLSARTITTPQGKKEAGSRFLGVLEGVSIKPIGAAFVAVGGKFTRKEWYGDFRVLVVSSYTRSEITLNPRFEGTDAFVIDLPEHARIKNLTDSTSGISYEWRHGKAVPVGTDFAGSAPTSYWHDAAPLSQYLWAAFGLALLGIGMRLALFGKYPASKPAAHLEPMRPAWSGPGP